MVLPLVLSRRRRGAGDDDDQSRNRWKLADQRVDNASAKRPRHNGGELPQDLYQDREQVRAAFACLKLQQASHAGVAQWHSNRFVNGRSQVRSRAVSTNIWRPSMWPIIPRTMMIIEAE